MLVFFLSNSIGLGHQGLLHTMAHGPADDGTRRDKLLTKVACRHVERE